MPNLFKRLFVRSRANHRAAGDRSLAIATDRPGGSGSLVVFDHIPKTAGTTFRRSYLIAAFPRNERWILSGGDKNAEDLERFLALPAERRRGFKVVAGHRADTLRGSLPDARFVTLVRDPVDRVVSSYLHAMFHADEKALWPDVREHRMGLREFVQKYEIPNLQSVQLLGQGRFDEQEIKEGLQNRYALVGCTEAFDQFIFMLHVREGFPLCLFNNRLVRRERSEYATSVEDLAFIRDLNAQDLVLHRVVRAEFQRQIDELPYASYARMTRFLRTLERFREATYGDPTMSMRLDDAAFGESVQSAASSHGVA